MVFIETGRGSETFMNTYITKKWLPSQQDIGICNHYEHLYKKPKLYG